ncbi:DUF4249 domain-containing protein [Polaribacter sp. MSW13]|uniref:DUF4249 domain-containing protein n=1 Tax=Polaribacter marinus TaxID=2916838 RepID=A0A9X1VQC3_9FLAO|nr:DUF4249 domain-containing protein [Polaribacter marinus]MCI2230315.1 DUF4249 domain-containing protein [Polaribacter marinus]
MKKYLVCSLCFILFFSCVEEFNLDLDKVQQRVVIEGLVENNTGPHYIRITKSSTGAFIKNNYLDIDENVEIIEDAIVIISDDSGQTEQLMLVPENSNDAIVLNKGGYYRTTNFVGEPNHLYTLTVTTKEGKTYSASDYMKPPPIINSLSYELRVSEKDGQEYYVPLLSFFEPQETKNYYLINQNFERTNHNGITNWEFEVLSDKNLNSGNIEVFLDNGASPQDFGYYYYFIGDEINIKMSSISQEAYSYFKFLLEQFKQDGGVYSPAPASPPTNIDNNGLGFFQASSFIKSKVIIE